MSEGNSQKGKRGGIGFCGIANIPNQVYQEASYQALNLNIMLMGELSLGKTQFVNRLLGKQTFATSSVMDFAGKDHPECSQVRLRRQEFIEEDYNVRLCLIDCPQIGHSVGKDLGCEILNAYTEFCLFEHLQGETCIDGRQLRRDNRVHLCVYFLSPHQQALSTTDLKAIKAASQLTNVIIAVAKSDLLFDSEKDFLSGNIKFQLEAANINLFEADGSTNLFFLSKKIKPSNKLYLSLESCLIRKYLPMLIGATEEGYYESYRSLKMVGHIDASKVGRDMENLKIANS